MIFTIGCSCYTIIFGERLSGRFEENKMPIILWSDKLSVGIAEIDAHHKGLILIVNQLHDAIRTGKGDQELGVILDKLIDYTGYHFRYEESLMPTNEFAGQSFHEAEHKALLVQVLDLQSKFKKGQTGLSIRVINFLKDWLTNHMLGEDKKLGEYLQQKGMK
jgi:hemerythrin